MIECLIKVFANPCIHKRIAGSTIESHEVVAIVKQGDIRNASNINHGGGIATNAKGDAVKGRGQGRTLPPRRDISPAKVCNGGDSC